MSHIKPAGVVVAVVRDEDISVALKLATVAESIPVTGESPSVDIQVTGTATNGTTDELTKIPTARARFAFMRRVPGVHFRYSEGMALPPDAHIGQVSLTVSDLDRSVPFYRDVLGFVESRREGRTAMLAPDGGRVLIELHERTDAIPKPRRTTGLYHVAILVPSRAALGRSLRRLSEKRWPISGAADHLVSEALYLDDPDGLGIEIYRDRPPDAWRIASGELAMATDPLDLQSVHDEPGAETPWVGLEAETMMGHVHLRVPHLDTAEAFYCGRIGFEPIVRRYPGALFVAAGGYHHHLGLNTWTGVGAPPPPENAVGLRAFTIESRQLQSAELFDETSGVTASLVQGR